MDRIVVQLRIILNETHKGLTLTWNYKFNLVSEFMGYGLVFISINFLIGRGQMDRELLAPSLLGYLTWFYALTAISNMSWNLREETQTGTLEQMYMSPLPGYLLLMGRVLATFIVTTALVILVGVWLVLMLDIVIPMRLQGVVVLLITVMGLFGFGFVIGGATLLFKRVEAFASLSQNMLIFLNGGLLPIEYFPDWLADIARLLPSTQGIIVLRRVVLDKESLVDVWQSGDLGWLIVHSAIYCIGGLLIFKWCEHAARRQGTLGQY